MANPNFDEFKAILKHIYMPYERTPSQDLEILRKVQINMLSMIEYIEVLERRIAKLEREAGVNTETHEP